MSGSWHFIVVVFLLLVRPAVQVLKQKWAGGINVVKIVFGRTLNGNPALLGWGLGRSTSFKK
jgi:hypothetical protein